jgi:hypothetical protein
MAQGDELLGRILTELQGVRQAQAACAASVQQ